MEYFLWLEEKQMGPYRLDQLRAMWRNGQVSLNTPHWAKGYLDWRPLRLIESLLKLEEIPITRAPYQPPEKRFNFEALPPVSHNVSQVEKTRISNHASWSLLCGFLGISSSFNLFSINANNISRADGLFGVFCFLMSISAIVLSYVAFRTIAKNQGLQGKGRAIAGFLLGCAGVNVFGGIVTAPFREKSPTEALSHENPSAQSDHVPPPSSFTVKESDNCIGFMTLASSWSYIEDCDASKTLIYQEYRNYYVDQMRKADTEVMLNYWRNSWLNISAQLFKQRMYAVRQQYLNDGRAIKVIPGTYKIVGYYTRDGKEVAPKDEKDSRNYNSLILYQEKNIFPLALSDEMFKPIYYK